MRRRVAMITGGLAFLTATLSLPVHAQDNYEIQVYAYDQVEPHHTMVELQQFHLSGLEDLPRRPSSDQPPAARNHRDYARFHGVVRDGLLHFYFRAKWPGLGLGWRPYSAPCAYT